MSEKKDTNPKDAVGIAKVSLSAVPSGPLLEAALGMMEGMLKYRRHNYRIAGVRASVYYDAAMRHLMAWWEGEDFDPDSGAGLHHVSKAIAGLIVLRDAMINEKFTDDRPPKMEDGWIADLNKKAKALLEAFPNAEGPFTQIDHGAIQASEVPTKRRAPKPHVLDFG